MVSDMPANHILEMHRKEPSLLQQPELTTVTAATHFSTGISIVRTATVSYSFITFIFMIYFFSFDVDLIIGRASDYYKSCCNCNSAQSSVWETQHNMVLNLEQGLANFWGSRDG